MDFVLAEREVIELHQFFEDWFTGKLEPTDANFARFADVMGSDFVIVTPAGRTIPRSTLLQGLKNAHNSQPNIRIWIENFVWQGQAGEFGWATYEEWQEKDGDVTGRVSTVLFQQNSQTPNQLMWQHVHETWLAKKRD